MIILVFDTETTGLPSERNASVNATEKWPYIVQLSYILYNTDTYEVLELENDIINIDSSVIISKKSTEIHKITYDVCKSQGISIIQAIDKFNSAIKKCNYIIAHNMEFDKSLIIVECIRNNIDILLKDSTINKYCTMKNSTNLCKIKRTSYSGNIYYKYPTLMELYVHLFNIIPEGLHNSIIDVLICLRCFCKMQYKQDILSKESIKKLYSRYNITN